jgi:hypothetical protein
MIFALVYGEVLCYVWFAYVEPFLHLLDKSHLITMHSLLDMVCDLTCTSLRILYLCSSMLVCRFLFVSLSQMGISIMLAI